MLFNLSPSVEVLSPLEGHVIGIVGEQHRDGACIVIVKSVVEISEEFLDRGRIRFVGVRRLCPGRGQRKRNKYNQQRGFQEWGRIGSSPLGEFWMGEMLSHMAIDPAPVSGLVINSRVCF